MYLLFALCLFPVNYNIQLYQQQYFVSRVIFSESANTSLLARRYVSGVIKNRIHLRDFGNGNNMYEVVCHKNQFSCINDKNNMNWANSDKFFQLSEKEQDIFISCFYLSNNDGKKLYGPSGRLLVYYHDSSIHMPRSWDNKYYKPILENKIDNLLFYSVIKK